MTWHLKKLPRDWALKGHNDDERILSPLVPRNRGRPFQHSRPSTAVRPDPFAGRHRGPPNGKLRPMASDSAARTGPEDKTTDATLSRSRAAAMAPTISFNTAGLSPGVNAIVTGTSFKRTPLQRRFSRRKIFRTSSAAGRGPAGRCVSSRRQFLTAASSLLPPRKAGFHLNRLIWQ